MSISKAERLQIENEMIFRRINEKVGDDLGALDAMNIEDGNIHLLTDEDLILHFQCECSDEKCETRIPVPLGEYKQVHTNRDTFIVLPNHQVDPIEKVIHKTTEYHVVKKNNSTSEPSDDLNKTAINNN